MPEIPPDSHAYETLPEPLINIDGGAFVVGLAIQSGSAQVDGQDFGLLVFRFQLPNGNMLPPMMLVASDEFLLGIGRDIGILAQGAVETARKERDAGPR